MKREIVKKAIHFKSSGEIPYLHWIDDETIKKYDEEMKKIFSRFPPFIEVLFYNTSRVWQPNKEGKDEWNCIWEGREGVPGMNVIESPLKDWELMDEFNFPDPFADGRFEESRKNVSLLKKKQLYIVGYVDFTLFERIQFLHGVENTFIDLYLHQDKSEMLADKITDFNIGIIRQWIDLGCDAVMFSDDYGFQRQLAMNPEKYRAIFKPRYKKMIDFAHKYGLDTIQHTCGNVMEIISDFIEIGLDVLQGVQPGAMDIIKIGEEFSGKICFMGGMDAQYTLPFGSQDDVKKQLEITVRALATNKGGYILSPSTHITAEVPIENIWAMYEALQGINKVVKL